jgi:hypothetical protein
MLYRYRLYEADGTDSGEAHYAVMVQPGELIFTGDGLKLRVIDVLPFMRLAPSTERD